MNPEYASNMHRNLSQCDLGIGPQISLLGLLLLDRAG